jgi:SAM-dependent methyltransferase
MYDDFSSDYDRFVNWPGRLAAELPFIERELQAVEARSLLDAACGTGMHTLALAQRGYTALGTDLSAGMIERARANAEAAGLDVRFEVAGLGALCATVGAGSAPYEVLDAVLCLGNSLPHLLTPAELAKALADFAACLRPGGLLLIQNRNFDAVMARRERWMSPQAHREGETEWLFVRFYDFVPEQGDFVPEQGDFAPEQGDFVPEQGDFAPEQGDFATLPPNKGTLSPMAR